MTAPAVKRQITSTPARPDGRRLARAAVAAAAAGTAVVVAAAPAAAAPSCAGTVFSGVARSGPTAVSDRVLEIKNVIIPAVEPDGTTFGHVVSGALARTDCSA